MHDGLDETAGPGPAPERPLGRWAFVGLCAAAAAAGGLGWMHPALFAAAWLWPALLAVILLRSRSRWAAFWGCWAASLVAHAVGFDWVAAMTTISLGYTGADAAAFAAAQYAVFGLFPAAAIAAASACARERVPAALWLPPAWLLAEHARFSLLTVSIDDWLATQWRVEPVLRLLGAWGWWPTSALCLAACAGIGEALARRRPAHLLPALAAAGAMLAAPPLPVVGEQRLAGIAAVHIEDDVTLPHHPPPGEPVELVVWPEDARHLRPLLVEGRAEGARVPPLLPGSSATHLIGLTTQTGRGEQQNQAVVVAADGAVLHSRAKRVLLPIGERSLLGWIGHDHYRPGKVSPTMVIDGRPVGALICGELLDRALVRQAVDGGARVLVVPARDQMMVSERALRHLLAMQVLRSVEFGIPSVRAALGGRAVFVSSDGRLLAQSTRGRNGFLMWDRDRGAREVDFFGAPLTARPPARPPPDVVVLYSTAAPRLRARCPEGRCRYVPLEGFTCLGDTAATVIVSGHGRPPRYLSHSVDLVAAAVRCHRPELVIVDTCFGASADLFGALGDLPATVVGATTLVPPAGLRYGPEVFTDAPAARRAAAVRQPHGELTRWRIAPDALAAAQEALDDLSDAVLAARVVRRAPMLARMPLNGGGVLVSVPAARAARLGPHLARIAARRSRERMRWIKVLTMLLKGDGSRCGSRCRSDQIKVPTMLLKGDGAGARRISSPVLQGQLRPTDRVQPKPLDARPPPPTRHHPRPSAPHPRARPRHPAIPHPAHDRGYPPASGSSTAGRHPSTGEPTASHPSRSACNAARRAASEQVASQYTCPRSHGEQIRASRPQRAAHSPDPLPSRGARHPARQLVRRERARARVEVLGTRCHCSGAPFRGRLPPCARAPRPPDTLCHSP